VTPHCAGKFGRSLPAPKLFRDPDLLFGGRRRWDDDRDRGIGRGPQLNARLLHRTLLAGVHRSRDLSASRCELTFLMTPGSMTIPNSCDLVVGAFQDGNVNAQDIDAGLGWVYRSTDDWCPAGAVDNAPDGGAQVATPNAKMYLTAGADNGWVATQMAFRPSTTLPQPQPTELVFKTAPQSVARAACSAGTTVESQAGGVARPTSNGIDLSVAVSPGLSLYVDAQCAWPMTRLFIGAGQTEQTFYFLATDGGTATVTLSSSGYSSVSQTETIE
jgi:hypothetical protein